jgi:hypothetical protein
VQDHYEQETLYCLYDQEQTGRYRLTQEKNGQGRKFTYRIPCDGTDPHQHPTPEQIVHLIELRHVQWLDKDRGIAGYRLPDEDCYTPDNHGLYSPSLYVTTGQPGHPKKGQSDDWQVMRPDEATVPAGRQPIADWPLYIGEFGDDGQTLKWKTKITATTPANMPLRHMPTMQMQTGMIRFAPPATEPNPQLRKGAPLIAMRRAGHAWKIEMLGTLKLPRGGRLVMNHAITLKATQALRRIAAIVCECRIFGSSNPLTVEHGPMSHVMGERRMSKAKDPEIGWSKQGHTGESHDYGFQNEHGRTIPRGQDEQIFKPLSSGFRKIHGLFLPDGPRTGQALWRSEASKLLDAAQKLEARKEFYSAANTRALAHELLKSVNNEVYKGRSKVFSVEFTETNKEVRDSITKMQRSLAESENEGERVFGVYLENFLKPGGILTDNKSTWIVYDGLKSLLFTPETTHGLDIPDNRHGKVRRVPRREWPSPIEPSRHDEAVFNDYKKWRELWKPEPGQEWQYLWPDNCFDLWMKQRPRSAPERDERSLATKTPKDREDKIEALNWWRNRVPDHVAKKVQEPKAPKPKIEFDWNAHNAALTNLMRKCILSQLLTATGRRAEMLHVALRELGMSTTSEILRPTHSRDTNPKSIVVVRDQLEGSCQESSSSFF